MKKFLEVLVGHVNHFVGNTASPLAPITINAQEEQAINHINTIQLALYKGAAVHVIYGNKSFTGDIVKFDEKRRRLVLKNFSKNMGSIIQIDDIKRIRMVPDTIRNSQKFSK
ncbi:hypothetical protein D3X11_01565 [Streptococcus sp. X16XC17]|uniref:hypothetical protein n=1 Tax=unclassified Streptococcus TaxID=2608887 RepID=UPI00066FFA4C|nr:MULTISPECIES: hypothetical protein [unclassified Streptococcus]TCD46172.1 hypothetical protein D3X11_01565 [Streptococcus sp. X16XC17]